LQPGEEPTRTNLVVKTLTGACSIPLLPLVPVTTFSLRWLLAIPPLRMVYALVMSMVSIPLLGSLVLLSRTWDRAPVLRLPLALVGVPIALISYVFVVLTTTHSRGEKILKLAICEAFPFSHRIAEWDWSPAPSFGTAGDR